MREIVHIQTGQCGNQIGAKVSTRLLIKSVINFNSDKCAHFFISAAILWTSPSYGSIIRGDPCSFVQFYL